MTDEAVLIEETEKDRVREESSMADHHSQDLDQLLDSALDDFKSLNLISSAQRVVDVNGDDVEKNKQQSSVSQFENVKGLGLGLPDLNNKKKGKQKLPPVLKQDSHINEALNKLREKTKEAVRGLEAVTGEKQEAKMDNEDIGDAMIEAWVKQFEELAGSQDMDSIVQTMMQHLLSKEILLEPMKEISERYPKWLEENKPKLTNEEYALYSHQSELVEELNQIYESEPNNFNKIVELLQKIHECGPPPNDILRELGPEFDLSSFGQLSPEMLESPENCCIM